MGGGVEVELHTFLNTVADRLEDRFTVRSLYIVGKKSHYQLSSWPGGRLQQSDTAMMF